MLEIEGLTVRYGDVPAVSDVSLSLAAGERVAVIGPSGCGKSTLLRAIAGLEEPAAGTIRWEGRDLRSVPVHERPFGLMFQDLALFPHRDVAGNVAFGPRMHGLSGADVRAAVTEALELVDLPGFERRAVASLSGGEQQRVALARSLAARPRLLMLDEPLGSLDRGLRERLVRDLRRIFARLETTIIHVTHDHDEAYALSERLVVMEAGRVRADGTPESLWSRPPSAFVARFLGLSNILDVAPDGAVLRSAWGPLPIPAGASTAPPAQVLLRPDAFRPLAIDVAPLRGMVTDRLFRGDHVLLRVEGEDDRPALEVIARWPDPPGVGDPIGLAVDAAGVVPLADEGAGPSQTG